VISESDFAEIVSKTLFLSEVVGFSDCDKTFAGSINALESGNESIVENWCKLSANSQHRDFLKRFQWAGIDLQDAKVALQKPYCLDTSLPWVSILEKIFKAFSSFLTIRNPCLPLEKSDPVPFEEIFMPCILLARKMLAERLHCEFSYQCFLNLAFVSESAYVDLERTLLKQISRLFAESLEIEFNRTRTAGSYLLNMFFGESIFEVGKSQYSSFIEVQLKDNLTIFFKNYPVLARFLSVLIEQWVENSAEFLKRLREDWEVLNKTFFLQDVEKNGQPNVIKFYTDLSDRHENGRCVVILELSNSRRLVYKPRNLDIDSAYQKYLGYLNVNGCPLDFRVLKVVSREKYGWIEYVEHNSIASYNLVHEFYQRSGALLCVLHLLRANDCHYENIIADGTYPVLIDSETLLHHEARFTEDFVQLSAGEVDIHYKFWSSVIRTGLLPRWIIDKSINFACDVSGLGSSNDRESARIVKTWKNINTDNMYSVSERENFLLRKNIPRTDFRSTDLLQRISADEYVEDIVKGFCTTYLFLMSDREKMLGAESLLHELSSKEVRFIFRDTRIYTSVLAKALLPENLESGTKFSLQLEMLSRAFLTSKEKPLLWDVLQCEIASLERLDIPKFTALSDQDSLRLSSRKVVQRAFKSSSFEESISFHASLSPADLLAQQRIIIDSFHAKASTTLHVDIHRKQTQTWGEVDKSDAFPLLSQSEMIEQAKQIANSIQERMFRTEDAGLHWFGFSYVPKVERFQLQVVDDSLYEGKAGIAIFFAALFCLSDDNSYAEIALQCLNRTIKLLENNDPYLLDRFVAQATLSGSVGITSIIYSFTKISEFLKREDLLEYALQLAKLISEDMIEADNQFDVISGSAGVILALTSLYNKTKSMHVGKLLEKCGTHLVNIIGKTDLSISLRQHPYQQVLTGFSHGLAGISYSLVRLYEVTQKQIFLDSSIKLIEYENNFFSASSENWADLRYSTLDHPKFTSSWCHGATGIGLARIGCLPHLDTLEIREHIRIALETTLRLEGSDVDGLCCGNFGRLETLLVASQKLEDEKRFLDAVKMAVSLVYKKRNESYRLLPGVASNVFNPGLFQGLSGIGYGWLRLAQPDVIPSILIWD
jgi:type 2 lantibiotic biosynthesis protein LanM